MRGARMAIAAVGVALAGGAFAHAPIRYDAEADQVLATYEASFAQFRIAGTSRTLEWSILQVGEGESQVRLRLVVDSFETGHRAVDAAVRSAMESQRFPVVEIEGTARRDGSLSGTILLHGVSRPVQAKLLQTRVGRRLVLRASFSVDLDAFGVAAPSMPAGKMGNAVDVTVLGMLRARPEALLSGGAVRRD